MKQPLSLIFIALLGLVACSSCATQPQLNRVKPWQRAHLAKPTMDPKHAGMAPMVTEHIYFSREASHGGDGVGGGGCGCN